MTRVINGCFPSVTLVPNVFKSLCTLNACGWRLWGFAIGWSNSVTQFWTVYYDPKICFWGSEELWSKIKLSGPSNNATSSTLFKHENFVCMLVSGPVTKPLFKGFFLTCLAYCCLLFFKWYLAEKFFSLIYAVLVLTPKCLRLVLVLIRFSGLEYNTFTNTSWLFLLFPYDGFFFKAGCERNLFD